MQTHCIPHAEAEPPPVNVRVRDVVRHNTLDLPPNVAIFRVPYDLFNPVGPVELKERYITYLQDAEVRTGRVAPAYLGSAHPGERVLVQIPPLSSPNEWWLVEVQDVDGVAAD